MGYTIVCPPAVLAQGPVILCGGHLGHYWGLNSIPGPNPSMPEALRTTTNAPDITTVPGGGGVTVPLGRKSHRPTVRVAKWHLLPTRDIEVREESLPTGACDNLPGHVLCGHQGPR